ncbi:hypothetical protein ACIQ6U_08195 [Lysinibacillus fusiformis]|uniref:hypothetical protein n=1 Tax=Lysinibacillus fusiformis TaxID=28031 RepID=UPI003808619C
MLEKIKLDSLESWKEEIESKVERIDNILTERARNLEIIQFKMDIVNNSDLTKEYQSKYYNQLKEEGEYDILLDDKVNAELKKEKIELGKLLKKINTFLNEELVK